VAQGPGYRQRAARAAGRYGGEVPVGPGQGSEARELQEEDLRGGSRRLALSHQEIVQGRAARACRLHLASEEPDQGREAGSCGP
jgi:hypothetical protein